MSQQFLEKLLQFLDEGRKSSTYKYALLIGLIDLCVEHGEPPTTVTTKQLARRVVELYWRQARFYAPAGVVLRQNADKTATIPRLIAEFQALHGDLVSPPGRPEHFSSAYRTLLGKVEWVLIEQPLPKLQRIGREEERFIYQVSWSEPGLRRAFTLYQRGDGASFDNRIRFAEGAAEALIGLATILRPFIQQKWMTMVQAINRLPEAQLDDFLFGADRERLTRLQRPLRELQQDLCFYCERSLAGGRREVDHFLAWSRYPDDGLDNLLLAHATCNRQKQHFLADLDFARRWELRSRERSDDLDQVADATGWARDRGRTFGVVAGVYQAVPEGVRLWAGLDVLRRVAAGAHLAAVHGFGRGLLGA